MKKFRKLEENKFEEKDKQTEQHHNSIMWNLAYYVARLVKRKLL